MNEHAGMGRRVAVDTRDKNFLLARRPEAATRSFRYWTAKGPALDQLATPHCVGFSGYQWLTSFPISNKPIYEPHEIYAAAQKVDEWEGEDYDGTSVRALFRVLKSAGYVSEYRWAPDVATIVDHLLTTGPVVVGTTWTRGMFMADRDGYIDDINGEPVGGHAYLLMGANRRRLTPGGGKGAVRILNSWGPAWADNGRAWMSFDMLAWLMNDYGEACAANEVRI